MSTGRLKWKSQIIRPNPKLVTQYHGPYFIEINLIRVEFDADMWNNKCCKCNQRNSAVLAIRRRKNMRSEMLSIVYNSFNQTMWVHVTQNGTRHPVPFCSNEQSNCILLLLDSVVCNTEGKVSPASGWIRDGGRYNACQWTALLRQVYWIVHRCTISDRKGQGQSWLSNILDGGDRWREWPLEHLIQLSGEVGRSEQWMERWKYWDESQSARP
jgi:hypothetical protein